MSIFFFAFPSMYLDYYSQKNNASNHGKLNITTKFFVCMKYLSEISNAILKIKAWHEKLNVRQGERFIFGNLGPFWHIRASSMSKNMGRHEYINGGII